MTDLYWLPEAREWKSNSFNDSSPSDSIWKELVGLAHGRLDLVQTIRLDKLLRRHFGENPPPGLSTKPVRLAVLASSTVAHLLPAIRVGGLRRDIWCQIYEAEYGQYMQELMDKKSGLHRFQPTTILFALDAHHLAAVDPRTAGETTAEQALDAIQKCWRLAKDSFGCMILQQTVLPVFPSLMGHNEHRHKASPRHAVARINAGLRTLSDQYGAHLIAIDERVQDHGIDQWHSHALWRRAKQEIDPRKGPLYGDLVGRMLAAVQGRSYKALVLDLDDTLWGGAVGDDGVAGIDLGQNSALGEAFVEFQKYLLQLSMRGVILAVCSKNDEGNALSPFEQHPEMVLKRSDIACFVANWQDKASNIRQIARALNISLDSLVFVDDNPFEREQVRSELPMVAVPELPEDPALYAHCLADAGYFEALFITDEDRERARQYQANIERDLLKETASDMAGYLRGLQMKMFCGAFDPISIRRVAQLISKSNQFNLTTRRYSEEDVERFSKDPSYTTWRLRLTDRFGDNGIIAVVIGKHLPGEQAFLIDVWLMSCRVLGRQVEEATLNLIAESAKKLGARKIVGEYCSTEKNGMVRGLYARLGFQPSQQAGGDSTFWELPVDSYQPIETFITLVKGAHAAI